MALLRRFALWVLGDDLSSQKPAEPAPQPKLKPKVEQRRADGDGFDAAPRAPVSLAAEVAPAVLSIESEPVPEMMAPAAPGFVASLDDLQDLVDEPMQPETEFIPEGGMSTQSLMQEHEMLAPELQAAASEAAARRLTEQAQVDSTAALMSEVESLQVNDAVSVEQAPEPVVAVAEPAPTIATEDLISEVESLRAPGDEVSLPSSAPISAPMDSAPVDSAPRSSEVATVTADQPTPTPADAERQTPAWLIPATSSAPPPRAPAPTDFNASPDDFDVGVPDKPVDE